MTENIDKNCNLNLAILFRLTVKFENLRSSFIQALFESSQTVMDKNCF